MATFLLVPAIWTLYFLVDASLVALGAAGQVFVRGAIFGVSKIIFLFVAVPLFGAAFELAASWGFGL